MKVDELRSLFKASARWFGDHEVPLRAVVIYGLFTSLGVIFMQQSSAVRTPAEFVALKTLQANHRLVADDVAEAGTSNHRFLIWSMTTRDDFYGRYVDEIVPKDGAISLEKTLSGPKLATTTTSVAWFELGDVPLADLVSLDVGDLLEVCNIDGDQTCDKRQYAVAAIACPDKAMSAACSAGIVVDEAQRVRLARARDKGDPASASTSAAAKGTPLTPDFKKKKDTPKSGKHAQTSKSRPAAATPEASPAATSDDASASAASPVHVVIHHVACDVPTPTASQPPTSGHH